MTSTTLGRLRERLGRDGALRLAGGVTAVLVAIGLFTRFGINGSLSRDEAIYTYGGQRLAHGVPPYASIFDPKAPLATIIAGAAAAVARVIGRNDIYLIRVAFFICSCLAVLVVYLLTVRLWRSVAGGIVAAVVFASFNGFAADALSGPDAKTPGVLAAVTSLWLITRRQWFWAGVAGSLAFLAWQPLLIYPVAAVLAAGVGAEAGRRRREAVVAAVGVAVPLAIVTVYFAAAGALGKFVEAAFVFPLTGVQRGSETIGDRLHRIVHVVHVSYKFSGVLLWVGLVALLVLCAARLVAGRRALRQTCRDPLICAVLVTLLFELAYAASDFQGYPDVLPLLAYPALGLGGVAAVATAALRSERSRRAAIALALALAAVLTGLSWVWFTDDPASVNALRAQRADACALERIVGPVGTFYALGDPRPPVLTHRRNPDRYIYLGSGVDQWKVDHTPGGFDGWTAQIQAADPAAVVVSTWTTSLRLRMVAWLKEMGYRRRYAGLWPLFLTPTARLDARRQGVALTRAPTEFAVDTKGRELPSGTCS